MGIQISMHSRFLFHFLAIFLILPSVLISCGEKKQKMGAGEKAGPPPPPKVDVYVAKTASVTERLEFPGSIIASEATDIHPEVSGRITYLNITEGKKVIQGTLLAKIYDGDLTAQLEKLKVQLKVAEETASRYEELLKISGVSKQEYDLSVLETSNIRADMAIVRSNIQRTEIRAPFTGTLGLKMISPGAYVTPSTTICSIRQTDKLRVDFTLPERFTGKIEKGMLTELITEGNSRIYNARITATESGLSEQNRSLTVRADIINADQKLIPGSFAKVTPLITPDTAALMVPTQAIIPQSRGKKAAILRDGNVEMISVETGIRDSAMVQVISGIRSGDTVIITGLMGLKPGMKASIRKIITY